MPNETTLKNEAIAYLEKRGAYVCKNWGGPYSGKGRPDLFVCYRGRFLGIELKNPNMKPREVQNALSGAQRREIQKIENAGGVAFVCNDVAGISLVINQLDGEMNAC
jgi:hypothetical protein